MVHLLTSLILIITSSGKVDYITTTAIPFLPENMVFENITSLYERTKHAQRRAQPRPELADFLR